MKEGILMSRGLRNLLRILLGSSLLFVLVILYSPLFDGLAQLLYNAILIGSISIAIILFGALYITK